MIIDSHQYFQGKAPEKPASSPGSDEIKREKEYTDREQVTGSPPAGINGVVAIQQGLAPEETENLVNLAVNNSSIKGVIGITDLESDDLPERLDYLRQFKILKGFRNPESDRVEKSLLQGGIIRGVKVLKVYNFTFDLRVNVNLIPGAIQFIDELPDVRIALDFTGDFREKKVNWADWDKQVRELASFNGIMCKITGLAGELSDGNSGALTARRFIDNLLDAFGPGRIMFGSGWPVKGDSLTYNEIIEINRIITAGFSDHENEMFFFKNAANFYKLDI